MAADSGAGMIPLTEAIRRLRAELLSATEGGGESRLRFDVKEIELELNAVVTRDGQGKATFKLLAAGADGSAEEGPSGAATQKVKLTLLPKLDGKDS